MGSPTIFNGRRTKLLTADGILTSAGRTLDFDGVINYIPNTGFEINATGYNAYANTAGSAPLTGTGGSPTVTIARSTTTPLIQTASGLFTKGASNLQGQGFSYDFTIDSGVAAQGLPCTISAYYKVASGTYASGDMTVWIYDVTNGQVIQPSGSSILGATVPQNITASFQPNINSTSYRLIFHVSTVSALAYTLQFDNISVSPNTYNAGSAATSWVAYTPTFTGVGTPTNVSAQSRRVGDTLEVYAYFVNGTVTGATASMTLGYAGANGNVSIDTSKIGSAANAALAGYMISYGAGANSFCVLTPTGGGNAVNFGLQSSGTAAGGPQTGTNLGTSTPFSVKFSVPIVGWGTSQVLSSDTATNIVDFVGTGAGGAVTASVTNIPVATVKDSAGGWTGSTYVVPVAGDYQLGGFVVGPSTTTVSAYLNTVSNHVVGVSAANVGTSLSGFLPNLKAGDVISFRVDVSQTLSLARFSIARMSGPAQVAASESVNMGYFNTAGTSIPNTGDNNLPFPTKAFDSHNAYNTSTGIYTVPAPGKYAVQAIVNYSSQTYGVNNSLICSVYKNGVPYAYGDVSPVMAIVTLAFGSSVDVVVPCIAGDLIEIRVQNTRSAGATTLNTTAGYNHLEIFRVGN